MKKLAIRLSILLSARLILYSGYDVYSHYMLTKLYKYIDAGAVSNNVDISIIEAFWKKG